MHRKFHENFQRFFWKWWSISESSIKDHMFLVWKIMFPIDLMKRYKMTLQFKNLNDILNFHDLLDLFRFLFKILRLLREWNEDDISHSVKSIRIRSFYGPYFPTFRLNKERYSVCGKMRTRETPNTDTFHVLPKTQHLLFGDGFCCLTISFRL